MLAQFVIGVSIGVNYVGISLCELRRVVSASVVYALILADVRLAFAELVVLLGLNDLLHGILAFAPGGPPEMVMLAILTVAAMTNVIFHHVLRLVIVMSMTPIAVCWRL